MISIVSQRLPEARPFPQKTTPSALIDSRHMIGRHISIKSMEMQENIKRPQKTLNARF